jgi:hypothetical protein
MALASDRIDTVWDAELEPDFRQYVIATAHQVLRQEQAKGFDRDPRVIVDRRPGAREEAVKLFGQIEYVERAPLGEIVDWIFRRLVETSPVLKGDYAAAHLILVNGREASEDEWRRIGPGDRLTFVNRMPYARKIEGGERFVGWNSRVDRSARKRVGGSSVQAPNGVYRVVYRQAKQRWGRLVFLDYKFVILSGNEERADTRTYTGARAKRPVRAHKNVRYPAIQLYMSAA